MKRTLAIALLTIVGSALVAPAFAQNFPDAPENHWAYEALENLKREGILVGYPDGTYKGPRDLTRYELAVALNAAYQRLKMMHDGLADQIRQIRADMGNAGGGGDAAGMKALADRLTAVESQVRGMGSLRDDVAAMKRMADEFQKELAAQGVDIEAMKRDLEEIKKAMGAPGSPSAVSISGDATVSIHTGEGEDDGFAMGIDGRLYGADEDGTRAGITRGITVFHEFALNFAGGGTGNGIPKWWGTLVAGNMIGATGDTATSGYGNQSKRFGGQPFRQDAMDVYIQDLGVEFENAAAGVPFKAQVGRLGWYSHNPMLYKRSDTTPYMSNGRWDDNKWRHDGIIASVEFSGGSSLGILAGKVSDLRSVNGAELQPMGVSVNGASESAMRSVLGAEAKIGLGDTGALSLVYLITSQNTAGDLGAADRMEVLGAGLDLNAIRGIAFNAGYGQTTLKNGGTTIADDDNKAYYLQAGYNQDNWGLTGGYRRVESAYAAPGSWQRIGTNWSPTNIEVFFANGHFNFNDALSLKLYGQFGETIDTLGGIPAESEIFSGAAKLEYTFNNFWKGVVGYEDVKVDFSGSATEIRQRWTSVGFDYMMGKNSNFRLLYQYGDVENGAAWGAGSAGNYKGSIVTSNLSIKF